MNTFGERLALAMEVSGFRNGTFADATGVSKQQISHFTVGDHEPSLEMLARFLKALPNIDARWLVMGKQS